MTKSKDDVLLDEIHKTRKELSEIDNKRTPKEKEAHRQELKQFCLAQGFKYAK